MIIIIIYMAPYITCKKVILMHLTINNSYGFNRFTSLKIHNSFLCIDLDVYFLDPKHYILMCFVVYILTVMLTLYTILQEESYCSSTGFEVVLKHLKDGSRMMKSFIDQLKQRCCLHFVLCIENIFYAWNAV